MDLKQIADAINKADPKQIALMQECQGKLHAMLLDIVEKNGDLPEASAIFLSAMLSYAVLMYSKAMTKAQIVSMIENLIDGAALVEMSGIDNMTQLGSVGST
jgi:hypothetical protein